MNASVFIQVGAYSKGSFLKQAYAEPPFKVADITGRRNAELLELMLMSSSPGVLDEDMYKILVELEENSALQLTTQSYQRLFSMKKGALQNIELRMAENTSFVYLPHPVVPHESAAFTASNKLYLKKGCNLVWGEVMTCGRKLNGERFLFSFYQSITEIFLNGRLVIKENLLMAPGKMEVDAIGQLEGFTHQASLIWLTPSGLDFGKRNEIQDYLSLQADILFGISNAPVSGLIIRLLGNRAEQLFECLKTIAVMIDSRQKSPAQIND